MSDAVDVKPDEGTENVAEDLQSETPATTESIDLDAIVQEEVRQALTAERDRTAELTKLGAKFGFSKDADAAIAEGTSVEEFRQHILGKSPEEWERSLSIKNPSTQESEEDLSSNEEASAAVATIKERRAAKFSKA